MRNLLYIDGAFVDPVEGGFLEVIDPATEECFAHAAAGTDADVEAAVKAARRAFEPTIRPRRHLTS